MTIFNDQLRKAPFVRLLLPLLAGIIAGGMLSPVSRIITLSILILLVVIVFVLRKPNYRNEVWLGITLLTIIFVVGFEQANNSRFEAETLETKGYVAILDEYPAERAKTYKATIKLADTQIKILAYFPKVNGIETLKPGTHLIFTGKPEQIVNHGNPFEFDYQTYINHRGIGHQIFFREGDYKFINQQKKSLKYSALIFRDKLIHILQTNGITGETLDVISSIALGARDELDKDTLQHFSNAGVIHVLSVSGLHVAIIFVVLDWMLRFIKRREKGLMLHTLLMLSTLWAYALISGMSPSVLRATAMFSFIVIGKNLQRSPNIYNSLAASAFILLLVQPQLIYDVGFQLSYFAVASIVWLYPVLYRQLYFSNYFIDKGWACLVVSVAAQIGTLPLTLYYFHQFPVYFWLANWAVIITSTLLLYLAFLLFIVAPLLPIAGQMIAFLLKWDTEFMLWCIQKIELLPFAVIPDIYHPFYLYLLVTAFALSLLLLYKQPKYKWLTASMTLLLIIVTTQTIQKYSALTRKEIVVFNYQQQILVAFTSGRTTTFVSDKAIFSHPQFAYTVRPYIGNRMIRTTFHQQLNKPSKNSNKTLISKNGFINFQGIRVILTDKQKNELYNHFPLPDLRIEHRKHSDEPDVNSKTGNRSNRPNTFNICFTDPSGKAQSVEFNNTSISLIFNKNNSLKNLVVPLRFE